MDTHVTLLAELLGELLARRRAGEIASAEDYRARAGPAYDEFRQLVADAEACGAASPAPPAEPLPRELGPYTLLRRLGSGGMGTVYEAVERALGRSVAVKVLHASWSEDAETRQRFEQGARAAAQVEHEHIVRVLGYGYDGATPYLAMAFVGKDSLHDLIVRLRSAPGPRFQAEHHALLDAARVPAGPSTTQGYVRRVAALLAGPADALAALHARGLLHRDVKPSNLLLDASGRLVLADFDLAKSQRMELHTATGAVLGTPRYMSPEQVLPTLGPLDGRTDVYSLGAVFYALLTLREPFDDEPSPIAVLRRVVEERPTDPRTLVGGLPNDARRVVLHALERRPEDRYPDAHAFADDLRALAQGRPTSARGLPLRRRLARGLARHWIVATTALVLLAAMAWFAWLRPGYLNCTVETATPAEVTIGEARYPPGRSVGRWLAPGRHRVVVRAPHYPDLVQEAVVTAGGVTRLDLSPTPLPSAPADILAWHLLQRVRQEAPAAQPPPMRSDGRGSALMLWPRGREELSPTGGLAIRLDFSSPARGTLSIESEAGTRLWSFSANEFAKGDVKTEVPARTFAQGTDSTPAYGHYRLVFQTEGFEPQRSAFELVPPEPLPDLSGSNLAPVGTAALPLELLEAAVLSGRGLHAEVVRRLLPLRVSSAHTSTRGGLLRDSGRRLYQGADLGERTRFSFWLAGQEL